MAAEPTSKPSFSPYRKWGIGLQVGLVLALVFAVVVMANYVIRNYPRRPVRLHLSTQTKFPLSARTLKFLETMTNQVKVTLYYDKDDLFYSTILELLNEYHLRNPRITLRAVDYRLDPGTAQQLKATYKFLAAPSAKNLVIFDCEGRGVKPVDGTALTKYVLEQVPGAKEREFSRIPVSFEGERAFTATLLAVTSPKPIKAYFLSGHGEHDYENSESDLGYRKFVSLLNENYVRAEPLSLLGTNVPADCNLLVVAGPKVALTETELEKIDQYLTQGGRVLALFNYLSLPHGPIGLETLLATWGVEVATNIVEDPERNSAKADVIVQDFSHTHPVVNPLLNSAIQLVLPRAVGRLRSRPQGVDAPQVEELAFSGPKAFLKSAPTEHKVFPLAVAVEKGAIKGVVTERGNARMIVVGDSTFLDNQLIVSGANRDFAGYAVNWLLDRPQLLEDLGPRPVTTYRLLMTKTQLNAAKWILLGGMPGAVLAIGGLVWLRRRT
ncbi:MAG TPA: GldG family protein [Verrucomicrobiae bacterium]